MYNYCEPAKAFDSWIFLFIALSGIFAAPAPCEVVLTKAQRAYLKEKGAIVFVSQTVYPPFEFVDKHGDHTGMCIELAHWMAAELGFKAQFTDTSFKQAQQAVLSGQAHVLTSFFFSPKRDQYFEFTNTIFLAPATIFVAAERPDIKDINDLNGKTIAMQKGDYAMEFLENNDVVFQVAYTSNFAEAADLVIEGKADVVIGDEPIVLYHLYSNDLTSLLKKVGAPLYVGQNCMAVREGEVMLQSILNTGIAMARKNGVLDRIQRKWLGVQLGEQESFFSTYGVYILVLSTSLLIAVLTVWFWNINLRKEVSLRTEALARSEDALRAVLFASPIGIVVLQDHEMQWHNDAMTDIAGYTPDELSGRRLDFLFADAKEGEKIELRIQEKLQYERQDLLETRWRRKDGSVFDCLLRFATTQRKHGKKQLVVLAEDITKRKRIQKKLRENEEFLNAVVENIPNMVFVKDAEQLRFVQFNKAGEELLGYDREELIGKNDYDFFPEEEADFFTSKDREVLRDGNLVDIPEEPIQTKHKGKRLLHTKKIPVLDPDGKPRYLLGISEDITERLAAEKARKLSEERLLAAIDAIDGGFAIYDADDRLAMYNAKYHSTYKRIAHAMTLGQPFERIVRKAAELGQFPCATGREDHWIAKRMAQHRLADGSMEYKLYDGRWIKIAERKTKDGGTVGFHVDITDIKQSEERMQHALKEKETLLKEIHHRVKNNMQVVSSLLSLQSSKEANSQITEAFLEAQNRVHSMALVHDILYRSNNLMEIDLQSYLDNLATHLLQAYASQAGRVDIRIQAGGVKIGIDQAVPCGLVVTELLTNSLKYAFPSGTGGLIQIQTALEKKEIIRMTAADNGVGLPPDFDPPTADTLGLRLVTELIEDQLEGQWQVDTGDGTRWIIRWPRT